MSDSTANKIGIVISILVIIAALSGINFIIFGGDMSWGTRLLFVVGQNLVGLFLWQGFLMKTGQK